jgi:hypothetical protein
MKDLTLAPDGVNTIILNVFPDYDFTEIKKVVIAEVNEYFDKEFKNAIPKLMEAQRKFNEGIKNFKITITLEKGLIVVKVVDRLEQLLNRELSLLESLEIGVLLGSVVQKESTRHAESLKLTKDILETFLAPGMNIPMSDEKLTDSIIKGRKAALDLSVEMDKNEKELKEALSSLFN